ncbi:UDP-glucuronosyltransferase 1-1-like [Hyposmocoma kahamanoa]|uniref:UDP-glucuronosyltransferase 1-1-like n=1 Tax=Hyposmocoma kahamanoa TaxID=1477025 RepID=UPI000E6D671E|nr:UDP-glucuronosyltransferase 1-1-like [Hyposmocoma kahamanoa]
MQARVKYWWLVLTCVATHAYAARLLAVLPTNTRSHYVMYGRLVEALARKHHQLTVISHFPMKNPPPNVEEISLAGTIPEITNNLTKRHYHSLKPDFVRNLEEIMKECVHACETVSRLPSVKALLNSSVTFDMVIVEVFGSECFLPLGQRFKAPVVGLLSSVPLPWVNEQLGNPEATSYVPAYMMGYGQRMNLWERFSNTIAVIWSKILYKYMSQIPSQAIADRMFGPGLKLETLAQNYSLVLSNSHFSINEVRPLVPALVEVGGLHLDESQKLQKDLKALLDASNEGVIYWSFGSMSRIETIPSETLVNIFEALSRFSEIVLIKMNRGLLSRNITVPDNVYTMEWIPQYATLCHPNVKLFISHGGLLGTQETVACGVPMLVVPLYADQALNAHAMSDRGVARTIILRDSTVESWTETLSDLLRNPKYTENSLKLRDIFLDRPMSPLDMGVYWIEYVLRHKGAAHLRSPVLDLPLPQYLLLDVVILCIAITLMTLFILHTLFRYLCTRCIKWWPFEKKLVFETKIFRKNVSLFLCLLWKYKVKTN